MLQVICLIGMLLIAGSMPKRRTRMYKVYYMWNGFRIEVGTFESEKRARKMIALKARYGKYCFIERI